MLNTDRPVVSFPETQNNLRANKTTSCNNTNKGNSYSQMQEYKLQNPKKFTLCEMRNNIDISLS